jgi:hypothetical protein
MRAEEETEVFLSLTEKKALWCHYNDWRFLEILLQLLEKLCWTSFREIALRKSNECGKYTLKCRSSSLRVFLAIYLLFKLSVSFSVFHVLNLQKHRFFPSWDISIQEKSWKRTRIEMSIKKKSTHSKQRTKVTRKSYSTFCVWTYRRRFLFLSPICVVGLTLHRFSFGILRIGIEEYHCETYIKDLLTKRNLSDPFIKRWWNSLVWPSLEKMLLSSWCFDDDHDVLSNLQMHSLAHMKVNRGFLGFLSRLCGEAAIQKVLTTKFIHVLQLDRNL